MHQRQGVFAEFTGGEIVTCQVTLLFPLSIKHDTTDTHSDMSNARPGDGSSRSADDALMAEVESLLASEETGRSGASRWSERQGWREWIKASITTTRT